MFARIATFEIKHHLRGPLVWFVFAMFFLLSFGSLISPNIQLGAVGNTYLNSPFAIFQSLIVFTIISIFIATTYVANAVLRDRDNKIAEIMYSTRVTKFNYLFGRFTGAFAVTMLAYMGAVFGLMIGEFWPSLDPERLGPFSLQSYFFAIWFGALPTIFVVSAVFFTIATLSRSLMMTYVAVIAFLALTAIAGNALGNLDQQSIAAMADPFGAAAYNLETRYWTALERNTQLPSVEGVMIYNRLLWLAVGFAFLGITYSLFRFETTSKAKKKKKARVEKSLNFNLIQTTDAHAVFTSRVHFRQFLLRTRFEVINAIKSPAFIILALLGVLFSVLSFTASAQLYGTSVYPTTSSLTQIMQGTFTLWAIIVSIYYPAEIIWREKQVHIKEIVDAVPVPSWVFTLSKLVAALLVVTVMLLTGVLGGIGYQLFSGFTDLKLDVYLIQFLFLYGTLFIFASVLSVFLQVLTGAKYVGMGLMVLYVLALIMNNQIGLDDPLIMFGTGVGTPYSDMNGHGFYVIPALWYILYYTGISVLLYLAAYQMWSRGPADSIKQRLKRLFHGWTMGTRMTAAIAFVVIAASGSYIFYNTHILNDFVTSDDQEQLQVRYEKALGQYRDMTLPRITDISLQVDIYPSERRVDVQGAGVMENRSDEVIDEVHIGFPQGTYETSFELDGASILEVFEDLNYARYRLDPPMQPGEQRQFQYFLWAGDNGFVHNNQQQRINENGTFVDSSLISPSIGFQQSNIITDRNTRRRHDLPALDRFADLDDRSAQRDSYLSQYTDWLTFEATVSTAGDQIALAPGVVERQWQKDGRNYYHYRSPAPIQGLFAFLSARYDVAKGTTETGVEVEIYYDPNHPWNVDRMIKSVEKSIDYFGTHFTPYQYGVLRIAEFPGFMGTFAQAFPGLVPWSEGIGFTAKLGDADDIDYVYYVGAHELAHQWWGHQVSSANVQGQTLLVETLAQYSALMVMEDEYGPDVMRRFLKFEMDNYLSSRGTEAEEELPIYRVENQQYIHYRKGSAVMYALKDYLGEDAVNRALSAFAQEMAYQYDPYPTSRDLIRHLRAVAETEEQQTLITDLMERIVLWDTRVEEASVRDLQDGRYEVVMTVSTKKVEADGEGRETEVAFDMPIDIGIFAEDPEDVARGSDHVIQMEKHHLTGDQSTLTFIVDREPQYVGIDPYNKLIDRNTDDNLMAVSVEDGESAVSSTP